IGWMALCLLAAWVFARPYGTGPVAVLALALVVNANMLLLYQPGDAKNDTMGLFFLLAAAAILVTAEAQRRATDTAEAGTPRARSAPGLSTGALIVAGFAAGLALGTKLNLLAPFGLLTLGVIAVAGAGRRVRTGAIWIASSLVTGGFWFARNLLEAGNPLPWINNGPLPGPEQLDINIREPHNVADYLLPPDGDVIRDDFVPGLHDSFGDLWPLVLVVVIGGFLLAIVRGRTPVIRMLGVVALLSGIAYLFTPLTAAGPEGNPTAFTTNLRYASPAIGLGALLLAVDVGLSRARIQGWLLGALAVLLLVQAIPVWDLGEEWERDFALGAIGLAFFLVVVPVGLALAARVGASRGALVAAAAAALAAVVAIGWPNADDYVEGRYVAATAPSDFPEGVLGALAWFNREDPHDARIAVVGGRPGFKQYVFYGDDLSNRVQYVARKESHGAYVPIASEAAQKGEDARGQIAQCEEWRQALNDGDYEYLIAGPDQRTQSVPPIEGFWTRTDPAATQLSLTDDVYVFRLDEELDAEACAKLIRAQAGAPLRFEAGAATGAGGVPEEVGPEVIDTVEQ
ncbi:MAG TPA: hypothetical protein VFL56_05915, partial [Solirubrobacterales bacterium]|nr:hypothetical protein [Solirubrobacterales bacterium]